MGKRKSHGTGGLNQPSTGGEGQLPFLPGTTAPQMVHLAQVVGEYQRGFAASSAGVALKDSQPLRFAAKLRDVDAVVAAARASSHFDLRRVAAKMLARMASALFAANLDFARFVSDGGLPRGGGGSGKKNNGNDSDEEGEDSDEDSDNEDINGGDEEEEDSDNEEVDEDMMPFEDDGGGNGSRKKRHNTRHKQRNQDDDQDNEDREDRDSDSVIEDDARVALVAVKDTNSLNRSLLGVYAKSNAASASASPSTIKAAVSLTGPPGDEEEQVEDVPEQDEPSDEPVGAAGAIGSHKGESQLEAQERIRKMRLANGSSKRRKKDGAASGGAAKKSGGTGGLAALLDMDKYAPPTTKLSDLGGIDSCIEEVLQLIGMPLKHPEVYLHLGIQPPRGILLHGPPGCGKSMLANAIAGESQVPFIQISAPSIVSGMSGESEKKIREIFEEAKTHAPCILFIDEIDAITPKRETAQREMERRIVAQLLTCMDDISLDKTDGKPVLVIGATNRPDSLDPALRRAGRFDREIAMGVPDEPARHKILQKLCERLRLQGDLDLRRLAKETPGYVGADLNALTAEAGMVAVRRIFKGLSSTQGVGGEGMDLDDPVGVVAGELTAVSVITHFLSTRNTALSEEDLAGLAITHDDFLEALTKVQPSSKREGFATVPDITWEDVGALGHVRDELRMSVVEPIKHPELFARVGITKPMGVLLYGPPGCGKTMLAKAVASESCCNFISVKGPELLNKFVGESERGVRTVFSRAASSAPCVIFFDELDALCPARSNDSESQSSSRLVNTLLTEMDGMTTRAQVYIIAATNRPDMIDPAMLRPGRLDKTLYVDLPDAGERWEILKTIARKTPVHDSVCLKTVAADARCEGYSGADLAALVREAAVAALRGSIYAKGVLKGAEAGLGAGVASSVALWVTMEHFGIAFTRMAASVSKKDRRKYELLKVKFSGNGVTGGAPSAGESVDV